MRGRERSGSRRSPSRTGIRKGSGKSAAIRIRPCPGTMIAMLDESLAAPAPGGRCTRGLYDPFVKAMAFQSSGRLHSDCKCIHSIPSECLPGLYVLLATDRPTIDG